MSKDSLIKDYQIILDDKEKIRRCERVDHKRNGRTIKRVFFEIGDSNGRVLARGMWLWKIGQIIEFLT